MVPVFVEIFAFIQRQVLDQRLTPNPLALLPRPPDRLVAVLTRRVHHIQRCPGHIGNHDGAVGGLALNLGRARIGMRFRPGVAICQQLGLQFGHHVAIFGVDQRGSAQFRAALE